MITLDSYVLGRWQAGSGKPEILRDPTSEEPLAQASSEGIDLGAVLAYGRDVGGPALRALGFAKRAELLLALSKAIHAHRDELLELSLQNAGTTRGDGKFDLDGATGTLAAYAQFGKELGDKPFFADGPLAQLGRTPRFSGQHVWVPKPGIAVHVNAFNFPAWNQCEKMACALLAGMPVLEKPGTPTALVAWRIARILVDSKLLPEGAFQFLAGSARDLVDHLGPQDVLSFTGSSGTGEKLRGNKAVVRHNTRVNIEADSLNAAVLAADVARDSETYDQFLANVEQDIVQKTGQKCTAVRRVFVPAERVREVAADLVPRLTKVQVGDPRSGETRMGPLASAQQLADVRAGITALTQFAEILCGGPGPVHAKGYFVAPTLLLAKSAEAKVFHELEVFGPVATLLPYSGSAADATRLVNLGGGGLVASLYSNDKAWSDAVVLGIAPWHGRVWVGSDKTAGQALAPGTVLPASLHGGPGRAGGGAELGGLRGLEPYFQRTAVQGFQGYLEKLGQA
ncbi:MAG: 3,4-dehydroadipyl-CoA semialdehyde dehydrogenase [Planctomycetes bacterium]|nr:3,4-dehydroadipyl-CoA semialdehyde dehydrogenase [Planctomycetota bacterium]